MGAADQPGLLIVAGEASGDRHAARLVDALRRRRPCTVRGVTVVTYAREERMSFDQSAFKKKHPRIAARFVTFTTIRRFLVKDKAFGEAKLRG